jgi:hypothetical protein
MCHVCDIPDNQNGYNKIFLKLMLIIKFIFKIIKLVLHYIIY